MTSFGTLTRRLPPPERRWPALSFTRACRWGAWIAAERLVELVGRARRISTMPYWRAAMFSGLMPETRVFERFVRGREYRLVVAPVLRLYFAAFPRVPDGSGVAHWMALHRQGMPLAEVAQRLVSSAEFFRAGGWMDDADFVRMLYRRLLDCAPDEAGVRYWADRLSSGSATRGQVLCSFSECPDHIELAEARCRVAALYLGFLQRDPDSVGFWYWVAQGRDGLVERFAQAPEFARMRL